MSKLKVLDLFSGIGGFSLGLERAGMETVAFCEQDGYACRVLRKHWPTVPIFEDVRTLTKSRLKKHGIEADIICGGFPCQDISYAGKGVGLDGERSGLWREYARLIRELKPQFAILENVAALRSRGLDRVLGDLATIGYDAEWHCIPASAVGAPHQRDRIWIISYPADLRRGIELKGQPLPRIGLASSPLMAYTNDGSEGCHARGAQPRQSKPGSHRPAFPDASGAGRKARSADRLGNGERQASAPPYNGRWPAEPDLPRVVDGLPHRVDRLRCLGNSVVPQIVEMIGRAIIAEAKAAKAGAA